MPAAAAHAASLEAYGHLPRLENVALSPDGARLAFVKTEENNRIVAVITVANHEMLGGTRLGSEKVRFIKWADNDHLMIVSSVTAVPVGFIGDPSEWFQMQVYDVASHRSLSVPDTDRNTADVVNDFEVLNIFYGRVMVRQLQGHTMLFVPGLQKTSSHVSPALIRVDLQTHDSRIVRIGRTWQQHWLVDAAGELAAEETYDPEPRQWRVAIRREGHMQEVASGQEMIELPRLFGFGPSSDSVLMAMPEADGGEQWHLLSLTDGKLGAPLVNTGDLDEPIEDPATQQMIGGVKVADTAQYVFFDPQLQGYWDSILRVFPEQRVHLESASADHRKFVVRVDGARGFKYELVDLDSHRADPLGEVYDHIPPPYEIRRVDYPAADGTRIPAYLVLPRGKPARNLPLIVMPHGGPAVRQTADFDWWSQALADQGYAVLQPNYRGSALGWKFMSAGFGEWGRKMQTDLSDGVRYLAREGIADPAKVCIVGGSYGGYAALAGVALEPGVYRCAVSVAGICDLKRLLARIDQGRGQNRTERYLDRYLGIKGPDDAAVDAISPLRHVKDIAAPVLLIHGQDDTVVRFEQSQLMYEAMREAKKDVQLVKLKDEDHWLSRSGTRLQMLESSVAFLRAHNPPD